MMNLLQVRRDVLLPSQFVEEFEQKLNAKDFRVPTSSLVAMNPL